MTNFKEEYYLFLKLQPARSRDVVLVYDGWTVVIERSVSRSELTSAGVRVVVEGVKDVFVFVNVRS